MINNQLIIINKLNLSFDMFKDAGINLQLQSFFMGTMLGSVDLPLPGIYSAEASMPLEFPVVFPFRASEVNDSDWCKPHCSRQKGYARKIQ